MSRQKIFGTLLGLAISSGIVRLNGISLLDEACLIASCAYGLIFYPIRPLFALSKDHSARRAQIAFYLLMLSLVASTIVGAIERPYFGKVRWIGIFLCFALFESMLFQFGKCNSSKQLSDTVRRISSVIKVSYFAYALTGFFCVLAGLNPAKLQSAGNSEWYSVFGTTAYVALLVPVILLPIVKRFVLRGDNVSELGTWLFIVSFTGIIFDSRTTLVLVIIHLASAIILRGMLSGRSLAVLFITTVSIFTFRETLLGRFANTGSFLTAQVQGVPTASGDIDRTLHYVATVQLFRDNPRRAVFGFGFLNSGFVLKKPLASIYGLFGKRLGLQKGLAGSTVSTFGLNALIIDLGLLGILLITISVSLNSMSKLERSVKHFNVRLVTYSSIAFVCFTIYTLDNVALWAMLSPSFLNTIDH